MSAPDISQLTSTQQEALQTYLAVTDQDPIAAIPILQRSEWNVQIAIARFFDGEPTTDPVAEARASLPSTSSRQTANLQYESLLAATRPSITTRSSEDVVQRVDTNVANEREEPPSLLLSIIFTPFNILYRVLSTVLSPFSFLVPSFLTRLFTRLITHQSRPSRRPLPPADNTRRFIREFSEEYGENNLPFSDAGFNLTLDNAKKDLKFLLVVLLSPNHDENVSWVRDTLLSTTFKTFLNSHKEDVVLWAGNVQDSEAYQVSTSIQCTKFPFAALICHASDPGFSGMTVVMRAVGPMPASELVAKLGTALTAHQAQLGAARAQRNEQQASRNLRQEQDSAYERSLAQDRERARLRREEQEAQARAEKEAQAQREAEESKQQKMTQWRRWRAQSLPSEPGPNIKDVIRVSIRMPSGDRVVRKFTSDAEMEELYAFVECYDIIQDQHASTPADEPSGYEHEYKFRLVSPMPRTIYDLGQGGSAGERIGKSGNLIVEPVGEADNESEDE